MEGQRPFGIFPKIHPFWWGDTSLSEEDVFCLMFWEFTLVIVKGVTLVKKMLVGYLMSRGLL